MIPNTTPRSRRRLALAVAASAALGIAAAAQAELLVHEPFDYAAGSDLNGQSGGTGWAGAWRDATNTGGTIQAGGLSHPGVASSGNHVLLSGATATYNIFRDIPNIAGGDGDTTWISFIGQRVGPAGTGDNPYMRGVNVGFFNTEHPSRTERVTVGNSSNAAQNTWAYIPTGSSNEIQPTTEPYTNQAWAVVRIDHIGDVNTPDNAYLFINPNPAVEPLIANADASSIGTFDYSGIDHVRPFIGGVNGEIPYGELLLDELRIGTTYADMSGGVIPEPTSLAVLGLGALAALGRRRR